MTRSVTVLVGLIIAVAPLAGCQLADEQMSYRDQQRRDCAATGGYFEENKIGAPDNYTCKVPYNNHAIVATPLAPAPPTNCHTQTTTLKKDDGTQETTTNQVCSSS